MSGAAPHGDRFRFESESLAETGRLGQALGRVAIAGLVVGLRGALGAGKTAFVRAVAEGLEVPDPRLVTSPTFILIQEYPGRLPIYHFDAYRLSDLESFIDLGVAEYFDGDGVCLVEWADRVDEVLPNERFDLEFTVIGPESRSLEAICVGTRFREPFERWRSAMARD